MRQSSPIRRKGAYADITVIYDALGTNVISRKTHANAKEVNSSLSYFCQFGDASDVRTHCILAFIAHMLREPVYSQLRTQQQLG